MDWTDTHCRALHRVISRNTLLYTEMVTAPALVHGDGARLLAFNTGEHPVALQIGGSNPAELAEATRMGVDAGYDEVNLNVGCPSDRVQSGRFGAVLMQEPELVAECVSAMISAAGDIEVTVKCRIGVDDQNPDDVLPDFLKIVSGAGVKSFAIHARKAWLQGLSPKQNRDVPPLDYPLVHRMKTEFPDLEIAINGGIETLADAQAHLDQGLDGVMIGRAAYHRPMQVLAQADALFGDAQPPKSAGQVIEEFLPYIEAHLGAGGRLNQITRHMLGLFAGETGARHWKRYLSDHAHLEGAGVDTLRAAYEQVQIAQERQRKIA